MRHQILTLTLTHCSISNACQPNSLACHVSCVCSVSRTYNVPVSLSSVSLSSVSLSNVSLSSVSLVVCLQRVPHIQRDGITRGAPLLRVLVRPGRPVDGSAACRLARPDMHDHLRPEHERELRRFTSLYVRTRPIRFA